MSELTLTGNEIWLVASYGPEYVLSAVLSRDARKKLGVKRVTGDGNTGEEAVGNMLDEIEKALGARPEWDRTVRLNDWLKDEVLAGRINIRINPKAGRINIL